MRVKGVIYIVAAAVLAVFALANWQLLMQPVEMNLLLARVQTPLAVLFLLFASILLLLEFGVHAVREHEWRRERRALARELDVARLHVQEDALMKTGNSTASLQRELAIIRAQLERVLTAQSAMLRGTPLPGPEEPAIEPELVPPRSPSRGVH